MIHKWSPKIRLRKSHIIANCFFFGPLQKKKKIKNLGGGGGGVYYCELNITSYWNPNMNIMKHLWIYVPWISEQTFQSPMHPSAHNPPKKHWCLTLTFDRPSAMNLPSNNINNGCQAQQCPTGCEPHGHICGHLMLPGRDTKKNSCPELA